MVVTETELAKKNHTTAGIIFCLTNTCAQINLVHRALVVQIARETFSGVPFKLVTVGFEYPS